MKLNTIPELVAIKDGLGNIIVNEDSFEFLLMCLDNQKFNPSNNSQYVIDGYNKKCRKILHQHYIFETIEDGYFLTKRYNYQDKITPWSGDDVYLVYQLFKDTKIEWEKPKNLKPIENESYKIDGKEPLGVTEDGWIIIEPETTPWLIERPMRYDHDYLTISEDGKNNRPWKNTEIENIQKLFNGSHLNKKYDKSELWKEQLEKMDISTIEKYLRKIKINKI